MKLIAVTTSVVFLLFAILTLPILVDKNMNPVSDHPAFDVSEEALKLHETLFIGDWHADSHLWNRDLSKTLQAGTC